MKQHGRVEAFLRVGKRIVKLCLEVCDERRALLSVSAMLAVGWEVLFGSNKSVLQYLDHVLTLKRRGRL